MVIEVRWGTWDRPHSRAAVLKLVRVCSRQCRCRPCLRSLRLPCTCEARATIHLIARPRARDYVPLADDEMVHQICRSCLRLFRSRVRECFPE